jgi:hypothetical protein
MIILIILKLLFFKTPSKSTLMWKDNMFHIFVLLENLIICDNVNFLSALSEKLQHSVGSHNTKIQTKVNYYNVFGFLGFTHP